MSAFLTEPAARERDHRNGAPGERTALLAVSDHLKRIARWRTRVGGLRASDPVHAEQMEAMRVAVRISRSEFDEIARTLVGSEAAGPQLLQVLRGYAALAEALAPRCLKRKRRPHGRPWQ